MEFTKMQGAGNDFVVIDATHSRTELVKPGSEHVRPSLWHWR